MFIDIRIRLLSMVRSDQEIREGASGILSDDRLADWRGVDSYNTQELKDIIFQIGWPTISKVGEDASHAAWLLVQHADMDVEFQKTCLGIMVQESSQEVDEIHIAHLYDRICVNEGRPQFFGTQFYNNEHEAYGPRPIELFEFVDERRKTIGLDSMVEYKERLKKKYSMQGLWV